MNNQPTRRADKGNPTVESHLEQDKEIRLFSVALRWPPQFTASEHLDHPGHLSLTMSTGPRSASFIVWSGTRNMRKSTCPRLEQP